MMSLWDALRMNMMISYQELVRTFPKAFLAAKMPLCDENTRSINFICLPQFQVITNIELSD